MVGPRPHVAKRLAPVQVIEPLRQQLRAAKPGRRQVDQITGLQGVADEGVLKILAQEVGLKPVERFGTKRRARATTRQRDGGNHRQVVCRGVQYRLGRVRVWRDDATRQWRIYPRAGGGAAQQQAARHFKDGHQA